jgi:hypothetical protein
VPVPQSESQQERKLVERKVVKDKENIPEVTPFTARTACRVQFPPVDEDVEIKDTPLVRQRRTAMHLNM